MDILPVRLEPLPVHLARECVFPATHLSAKDHTRAVRVRCRALFEEVESNARVVDDDNGRSHDGNRANGAVEVLELAPVFPFLDASRWKVSDIADDGFTWRSRRKGRRGRLGFEELSDDEDACT